jgi:hypothetical protein
MTRECQVRFCEELGVNSLGLLGIRVDLPLPVLPDKRTFSASTGMSQGCHTGLVQRSKL